MVIGGSLANKGSELFVKFYLISVYIIVIYVCLLCLL
nr:MAG TPA: Phospholamban [Caudoviricetes sp.]